MGKVVSGSWIACAHHEKEYGYRARWLEEFDGKQLKNKLDYLRKQGRKHLRTYVHPINNSSSSQQPTIDRSKIKLSHFVEFGALIRMVLVRGASEQPFLRYSNFKDNQIILIQYLTKSTKFEKLQIHQTFRRYKQHHQ